jgi:hypothetical protein
MIPMKVTGKADKHPLYILINSDRTHNFINNKFANKL